MKAPVAVSLWLGRVDPIFPRLSRRFPNSALLQSVGRLDRALFGAMAGPALSQKAVAKQSAAISAALAVQDRGPVWPLGATRPSHELEAGAQRVFDAIWRREQLLATPSPRRSDAEQRELNALTGALTATGFLENGVVRHRPNDTHDPDAAEAWDMAAEGMSVTLDNNVRAAQSAWQLIDDASKLVLDHAQQVVPDFEPTFSRMASGPTNHDATYLIRALNASERLLPGVALSIVHEFGSQSEAVQKDLRSALGVLSDAVDHPELVELGEIGLSVIGSVVAERSRGIPGTTPGAGEIRPVESIHPVGDMKL